MKQIFEQYNVTTSFVDMSDIESLKDAITSNTKVFL